MIISHTKRFVFFRTPKTGSTTAEFMLRISQAFDPDVDYMTGLSIGMPNTMPAEINDKIYKYITDMYPAMPADQIQSGFGAYSAHITPAQAIEFGLITLQQLRDYSCYAYLREPYKRAISAYKHSLGIRYVIPSLFYKAVEDINNLRDGVSLLWKPQYNYFFVEGEQVATPLNYEEFDAGLRQMIAEVGGVDFREIPQLNSGISQVGDTSIYDSVDARAAIEAAYPEDKKFYDTMIAGGK